MLKDYIDLSIEAAVIKLQEGQPLTTSHIFSLTQQGVDVAELERRFAQ